MFEKTSLRLAVLAVLLFAQSQGNPVIESENKDGIQATASRDARISPSDWLHFNHSWSFPSLPSVTGLFGGDDNKEGRGLNLRKRVDALEKAQQSINEILKNLTRDVSALTASCADKGDEWTIVSPKPVTNKPEIATGFPTLPEGVLPEKPATNKPEIATGFPTLPEGTSPEKPATNKPEIATGAPTLPEGTSPEKPATNNPAIATGAPSSPEGTLPEKPEAAEEPDKDTLMVIPPKPKGNGIPNLSSDGSSAPEIPEKIVIASTNLEDSPGENPFGSISLVGFAPSHDSRLNSRMPWNKDHKSNEKAI